MARKRPWRSGLTPIPVSPMPPSPARPSDGPGPGPHPPVPPILRGGGRSAAPRRPACNHAVAPYCRRRVRGPPGPMPGTGRTGPLERVHPGRLGPGLSKAAPTAPDERGGGGWRAPHTRPCGRPRRSGCLLGPSCRPTQPASGQRGIRRRGRRPGRAPWGASATSVGTPRQRSHRTAAAHALAADRVYESVRALATDSWRRWRPRPSSAHGDGAIAT